MARGPKDHPPLSPEERMAKSAREDQVRRKKEARRQIKRHSNYQLGVLGSFPGWIRVTLQFALAIVLILMVDGVRRENHEFQAKVSGHSGQVQIQKKNDTGWVPVLKNSSLADGDMVTTGPGSYCVLSFPDGSAMQLNPNTRLKVRMLEYSRNGMRTRSFMLEQGFVVSRVSNYFGNSSALILCTPNTVAMVQSSGAGLEYNSMSGQSTVMAMDGVVNVQSGNSASACLGGQSVNAMRYEVSRPRKIAPNALTQLQNQIYALSAYEKERGFLEEREYKLNAFLDPAMQIVGLAPGGWNYFRVDFFARTACKEALSDLRSAMESSSTRGAPPYLNPVTLSELGLSAKEADEILSNFQGMMLLNYYHTSANQYTITVRARDKKKSIFEMTELGIVQM